MEEKRTGFNLSARSFIISIAVIFALMIAAYVLASVIPGGEYVRVLNEDGNSVIDQNAEFSFVDGGLPFWKWLLSPILVLGAEGSSTLIAVIIFLLVIGGIFNCLEICGLMGYMLDKITFNYFDRKYKLMSVIMFFFMAMGALIGSFEECVPLVPIVVALAVNFGWDTVTGMGMSLLAAGCGFASGVFNPFTVGVAQELAGLPMFSGAWLRLLSFVLIYLLLVTFVRSHAKKIEKKVDAKVEQRFTADAGMDRGLKLFVLIIGLGIAIILCSGFIKALQDYTMIIVAVMFLIAGIVSSLASGLGWSGFGKGFGKGAANIFPAVLMILMAASIKYTLEESKVLDTILHGAVGVAEFMPKWAVILFIYFIVLIMNFFVASGSAKAFMLIPLIVPMAQIFGISSQLCIVAFAFGDGFSNVFYPTNAALLISLGLVDVGYSDWAKYSWKFQAANLLLTSLLLLLGLAVGY